jgi:hypothetical protein
MAICHVAGHGHTNTLEVCDGVSNEETFNSVKASSIHIDHTSFLHITVTVTASNTLRKVQQEPPLARPSEVRENSRKV